MKYFILQNDKFFSFSENFTSKLCYAIPFPNMEMAGKHGKRIPGYAEIIEIEEGEYLSTLLTMTPIERIALAAIGDYLERRN